MFCLRAVKPFGTCAVDCDGESWDRSRIRSVADGHEAGEGALLGNASGCIGNRRATFGEEALDNGVVLTGQCSYFKVGYLGVELELH